MATLKKGKYDDYKYEITSPEELREAKWLIAQGDFKDLEDYIERSRLADIRMMKRLDKERSAKVKKHKLTKPTPSGGKVAA